MADIDRVMGRIRLYMETAAPVKAKKKPTLVRHRRPLGKWATKPVNRTSKPLKPTNLLSKGKILSVTSPESPKKDS